MTREPYKQRRSPALVQWRAVIANGVAALNSDGALTTRASPR